MSKLRNPRTLYALLFQSVSDTLIEFGENPRWAGGAIAATLVLHTWGQPPAAQRYRSPHPCR